MSGKYFPIKTASSCQLKWTWSTVHLYQGSTNSCHRVGLDFVTPETFDQFHNTPKKIADRKLMLDGQWPQGGCEYCKDIESAGGSSDRLFHLQIPNLVPPELEINPTAVEVTPQILEVYLDNVCNMSCIYCSDLASSKIKQENIRFGPFEHNGVEIKNFYQKHPNFELLSNKFWQWLENNYNSLKRLHIAGGEPLFQEQFETCLQFLDTHENRDLEFNIISNLNVSSDKLKRYIDRVKNLLIKRKIKRFEITASIDCWGAEQEYVRYGLNLDKWKRNFEYVAAQPWLKLNINQTLTSLTLKTSAEMLQWVQQYISTTREIGHHFSLVAMTREDILHPGIFGPGYFDQAFENMYNVMSNATWQQRTAIEYLRGIQKKVNIMQRDQTMINRLAVYLDELDRRRGLSWRETFPWLVNEVNNVV